MTTILFIQGGGSGAHDDWDSKLVDSLARQLGNRYAIAYPLMPDEADPSYDRWSAAICTAVDGLAAGDIVVGHSIGASILINALAATAPAQKLGGIFLLSAPFIGAGGWPAEGFEPAPNLLADLALSIPVWLYQGDADETVPFNHLELYAKALPSATTRRLPGRDHQLNNNASELAADILGLP